MLLQSPSSLQFGITIRAWSLVFAAHAYATSKDALKAMELIVVRCRKGTLRVHIPNVDHRHRLSLNPYRTGIAGLPLELLLCLRDNIIDSALHDAEQKFLGSVKAAHHRGHGADNYIPFSDCLHSARYGPLNGLCKSCETGITLLRPDFKAIDCLLSKYSLSLTLRNTKTPLLLSPPYHPEEPHPWVIALPTHHSQPMSRASSYLPLHTPSLQEATHFSAQVSFFSPGFMRITSADIMRFRNLVRTWRLVVVELCGTVASRGVEPTSMKSRYNSKFNVTGAILGMEAMDLLRSRSSMGHCEPKWMLLSPQAYWLNHPATV